MPAWSSNTWAKHGEHSSCLWSSELEGGCSATGICSQWGRPAWAPQSLLQPFSCSATAHCSIGSSSFFVPMGMDVTVTLPCNFPGCAAIAQSWFLRTSQNLHSSVQINILALLRVQIPLSSFPSFLLSVSFYSLPLTLSGWSLVRWCCHCMGNYGKWMAGDFFHWGLLGSEGRCVALGNMFTFPCLTEGLDSPSSAFPLPFNGLLKHAHSYLLDVSCLDLYSGQFSWDLQGPATSPESPIFLFSLCDSLLFS